ncbi:hypothetical protein ACH4U5_14890 [Streptomyces sp. NPDC020858]
MGLLKEREPAARQRVEPLREEADREGGRSTVSRPVEQAPRTAHTGT